MGGQQEDQWGANGKDDNRMDSSMKEKKPVYFTSERVSAHVTRIRGAISEYMYLVEGEDRALLTDSGRGVEHRSVCRNVDEASAYGCADARALRPLRRNVPLR